MRLWGANLLDGIPVGAVFDIVNTPLLLSNQKNTVLGTSQLDRLREQWQINLVTVDGQYSITGAE